MEKLRLEVIMAAREKITGPLKRVMAGSGATSRALKDLRDSYKQLERQQGLIGAFRNAHKAANGLRAELAAQQAKVKALALEHAATGTVTAAMARKMEAAQATAAQLKQKLQQQQTTIQHLRDRMGQAGMSTSGLADQERRLRTDIERTNSAITQQKQRLQSLHATQQKASRVAAIGTGMTATGMGMAYGASRAGHAAVPMMGQARHAATEEMRIRALGLGTEESSKAIQFAKNFKSYGTSQLDNLELMRDAVTVFNDRHHAQEAMPILADMKFANEAAFGSEQGADNSRKFMDMMKVIEMRGGANTKEDFERNANMVQQVITATGGRVGAADWMHVIQRGKLAAKGFDEKEFYYRLEPLVQEMGGDAVGTGLTAAYQNLYQGRTTKRAAQNLDRLGLIGDYSKVKHDKVGQTAQLNPGALKGADIFRRSQFEWMEKVLIPALRSKGIESEQETIDAIGSIFSNTNAGALMATMYQQRAMIQKGYELNSKAANIKELKALSKDSPVGKEIALRKRRDDLYMRLGDSVLPGYVKLLEAMTGIAEKTAAWATVNPQLTKTLLYVGAGAMALVGTMGALMIPMGFLLMKGALLRMMLPRLGLGFLTWGNMARAGGAALSWLWTVLGKGTGLLVTVGRLMLTLGGTLLRLVPVVLRFLGPWGVLAATVASAAAYVWANWSTLGPKFAQFWSGFKAGFIDGLNYLQALPARFFAAGAALMQGVASGISSQFAAVRNAIAGIADSSVGWFKEKLGIHSPSRVFMELGGYVSQGAALGIESSQGLARKAALGLAAATMVPMALATPAAQEPLSLAVPPAQAAHQVGGLAAPMAASTYNITIHAAPGMDPKEIARTVSAELERRERAAASRRFSSMSDGE